MDRRNRDNSGTYDSFVAAMSWFGRAPVGYSIQPTPLLCFMA